MSTEIYNQKWELSKYKPTSDLQAYIDEKTKRLENWVSLGEQDLQRSKLEISNLNVEFQERYNSLSKWTDDLTRDIQNAIEVMNKLEDFQNTDWQMSSKNKKIMSGWEQKINEFELKFLTTLKQTDKFDSLE
mgnify:FL=1